MRRTLFSNPTRRRQRKLHSTRLVRMLALAALGGSLLVGLSAGTAGALVTVTGHMTFYSLSSLGLTDIYPQAIAGTPSGDIWFIADDSPLNPLQSSEIARITTSGTLDGSAGLDNVGESNPWVTNLAVDSSGNAYFTDGGLPGEATNGTSIGLSEDTSYPGLLRAVTVEGTTPYWGASPDDAANELYSGFPTVAGVQATVDNVDALTATSGEVDMMQGTTDYGFYPSFFSCIGGAQFFPSGTDIVNLVDGSAGLWFADANPMTPAIWQYTGSCSATRHKVPDGSVPRDITEGSDGNVYFTTSTGVWEFFPSTGVFFKYTDPDLNNPQGITLGSDGNIWFTNLGDNQIGKLVPLTPNPYAVLHQWTLPTGSGSSPCVPCHWMAVNQGIVPPGYGGETDVGYVFQSAASGLDALYACTDSGGQGDFLSTDPTGNCADSDVPASGPPPTSLGIQGYVYSTAPTDGTDALELYQCNDSTTNDWLSDTTPPGSIPAGTQPTCPSGYAFDDVLGYIVNAGPPAVTPEIAFVPALAIAAGLVMGVAYVVRRRRTAAHAGRATSA